MENTPLITPKKRGQQMVIAERNVIISKMVDYMTQGYMSTNKLSKKLGISRTTVENYKPLANELIGKMKIDRNAIRALQIRRTYEIIESLMDELRELRIRDKKSSDLKSVNNANSQNSTNSVKDRSLLYNQIYKFSSHLALITGLNIETQVHVDPQKLVIIRSKQGKQPKTADILESPVLDQ